MRAAQILIAILGSTVGALGQTDRQAIPHYAHQFEKYLGEDITLMVARATRQDKGEHRDVAIFSIYTKGQRDSGYTHAVVPRSEADTFARRYAFRDFTTRPLRGTFLATTNGNFYISFKGAEFPNDAAIDFARKSDKGEVDESLTLPPFDPSPIKSFSYDGKRLIEARITEITRTVVRVEGKHSDSVNVPLARAIKMPELKMRAKDAMESALAQAD